MIRNHVFNWLANHVTVKNVEVVTMTTISQLYIMCTDDVSIGLILPFFRNEMWEPLLE